MLLITHVWYLFQNTKSPLAPSLIFSPNGAFFLRINHELHLRDLSFPSVGFEDSVCSSEMLHCVAGLTDPDVPKEGSAFVFKASGLRSHQR